MMRANVRRRLWLIAAIVALGMLVSLFGCAAKAPEAEAAKRPEMPLIWRVEEGGATLYLLGSIHAAKDTAFPMHEVIDNAFEGSDYLAVECDVAAFAQDMGMQMKLAEYMFYMDGRKASDIIGDELYERAVALLSREQTGVPAEMLELFTPYSLMSLLQNIPITNAGLSAEAGVDMHFLNRAKEKGMEILEVESIEAQLKLLNGFSPEIHQYIIESSLKIDEATEELSKLYAAWEAGDEEQLKLYALIDEATATDVELEYYSALGPARNVGMADAAEQYLKDGKNVFYVVGAMHMMGDDGIVALLKQRGYTVELI